MDLESVKHRVKSILKRDGALRRLTATAHAIVIRKELFGERVLDAMTRRPLTEPSLGDLTAIVKTFERPAALRRLIGSVRRRYPDLKMVVVDDSKRPTTIEGAENVHLPYDSGLSAGRRAGLSRVTTKYVLTLDDDFVFYRHTRVERALHALERNSEIDIVGGEVVNLPFFDRVDYREPGLFPTDATPTFPVGTMIGGLPVYEKVADFFVARSDRLRLVDWGPDLKRVVHTDFFTRARGVLTTVFDSKLKVLHAQTPFDEAYIRIRRDCAADYEVLEKRWYP
jgi:glycosyltransferase involved in cell wall biosynthesis